MTVPPTRAASAIDGRSASNVGEEVSRDGDLGHLGGDVAAVTDDLRADLYGGVSRITRL